MNQLTHYNKLLRDAINSTNKDFIQKATDFDGLDLILRNCLSIEDMRNAGSFFTGQKLASKAISHLGNPINSTSRVIDPTCGAGNLLIECSRSLMVENTLSGTLNQWGKVLFGYDIYPEFIEAAKLRLIIEALSRKVENDCDLEMAFSLLHNIQVKDALEIEKEDLSIITHTIMNPPFTIWPSPQENYWKLGKVNAAGVVFDKYLRMLPDSCEISAILPDVLRSGSRYSGFRDFVSSNMKGECSVWGRFDSKTDVDVFILSGKKFSPNNGSIQWYRSIDKYTPLSLEFDVRTGPLVSYRDAQLGDEYPYIHPRNATAWKVITKVTELRRFSGTVIEAPFVVIKRTSSPGDRYRASASVINTNGFVAIENHMIVIKPKDLSLKSCKKLLNILKSKRTNDFLNQRIRLRHLTVAVVKDIPID